MGSSKDGASQRSRRIVAFEIGPTAVTAIEVELRGGQARTLRSGSSPIGADVWENLGANRDALTHAIRGAASAAGIRASRAVVALPRRYVTVKYARLPQGSPEQIAGMVRYEAQQYVPFPMDEVVLDHQIVSDSGDDMTTVMIVAARQSLVNDLLAAFDRASIEITQVSVTSMALAEHIRSEAMPVGILSVNHGRLDLAVAAAGRILFSREADIREAMVGLSEAETITAEIARSLAAYQNEHRSQPVERLILAGVGSDDEVMAEHLRNALQMPISVIAEPAAVAVGLALHQAADSVGSVNLLPLQRIERRAEARKRTVTRLTLVLGIALAAAALWFVQQGLAAQSKERRLAAFENRRLKTLQGALKRIQEERDRLAEMHRTVSLGLGRDRPVVDVLKTVSDAMPKDGGIYLTQLTFDRNGPVVIHGAAGGHQAVTNFLMQLQASGTFVEARLGYLGDIKAAGGPSATAGPTVAAAASDESTSFMLYCRLPRVADDEDKSARGATAGKTTGPSATSSRLNGGAAE